MKIALLSHEFPPYISGGIGLNCYDLAHSLSKKGVDVTVFCGISKTPRLEKVNSLLKVYRLPLFDFSPRFLWFQIRNLKFLANRLDEFDVIHGVSPTSSAFMTCLKEKLGKPFVTTLHEVLLSDTKVFLNSSFSEWTLRDFGLHVLEFPLFNFLINQSLSCADHVIVCGRSAYDDLKLFCPKLNFAKISVIHNGIDLERIPEDLKNRNETDCSVIHFGRLVWTKGSSYLLKAVKILKKDYPEIKVEICGDGPFKPKIESLIRSLNLQDTVSLKGFVPNPLLIRQILSSQVAVFPTLYEVGPFIAALEAMACEKPIVAFDMPFSREFIKDNYNGLLSDPSVEGLAERIRFLLSNKEIAGKIGQNARADIEEHYNWNTLVSSYIEVYENLLRR